ncbi:MAG TPA: hypothetical protein VNH44_16230 [Micropepsaceae bacterium]|nr:hypothetical protein [Micropepsaceae bacterium]
MATKKNTHILTLIGRLAKQRTQIFSVARADRDRTLTPEEIARQDALASVIAHITPESSTDRAVLADIAYERVERLSEGHGTQEDIQVAYAALRSLWSARPEHKRAA